MRRPAAVLVFGLLRSLLHAQSAELTNGVAGLTLSLVGGDVRATRLRNLRDNVDLALNPTAPLFVMELEPDPSAPTWAPDQRIVLRSRDFALGQPILLRFAAGIFWNSSPPGSFVLLPFLPRVVTPPASSGQGPFLAGAGILYRLFDGEDTIDGKVIAAAVELPGMPSNYRVWRVDFPVIDVPGLSGTGQDALATGAFGGLLLGDPIQRLDLQWPDSGLLDPDFRDLQPGACDPGGYAVPLLHYSDPPSGRGVWFSTDDMTARLKHLRANAVRAQGTLRLSGGTFPEGDPFQAQVWESQVWFQLGAFAGDWRAAAEKYRRQMSARSGWHRGPVGSAANTVVPPRLKSSAVHAVQGTSACQYGRTEFSNPADLARLLSQLSTLDRWCGPVAHVDWDRFPVHEWSEVGSLGFTASQTQPIGAFVRSGRATAPAPGHGIADRALTEGLLALWCDQGQCLSCPNPAVPPGVAALMADNRDRILPHSGGALFACPRGRGLATGIDFPAWLAGTMGSAVRTLGLTGFTWTAPAFYGAPCFARTHAHAPGYGNALAQGWLDIARAVRAAVPGGGDLTVMMETANAWFGQEVCLQNDWSFAAAAPGYTDCFNPARARALFHGLPIRSIPLFAVVADHVKLGSVYHKDSLSLPHTAIDPKTSVGTQYFDQFPAAPASLAAWSQATRTLARRGMVFLGLEGHEDLLAMETPGTT